MTGERRLRAVGRLGRVRASGVRLDSCVGRNPGDLAATYRVRYSDGLAKRRLRAVERLRRGRASGVRLDSCLRRNDGKGRRSGGKGAQEWRKGGAGGWTEGWRQGGD